MLKKVCAYFMVFSIILVAVFAMPDAVIGNVVAGAEEIVNTGWDVHTNTFGTSKITLDTKNVYKDSAYSIKIENTDYNCVVLKNTFELKPETTYRFSAYVKYKGYDLKKNSDGDSGGRIGAEVKAGMNNLSDMQVGSEWKKLTYTFTTEKTRKSADFIVCNGLPNRYCKGTAWFSDIRLEETVSTNQWDVLCLVVKDVNAKALVDGKTIRYKAKLNDEDVKYVGNVINMLKTYMPEMSGGLVGVRNVDVIGMKTTLKTLSTPSNCIDTSLDSGIAAEIDKYLAKKQYQQIIITAPLSEVADGWAGMGGTKYKGINICQVVYDSGSKWFDKMLENGTVFKPGAYIHEILHGVDFDSKAIDGNATPDLHENVGIYSDYYSESDGWHQYYSDYMSRNLPDDRGINPKAFWRTSFYTLASDDMTPGTGIEANGTIPTHISEKITTSKIKDKYYSGKSIKPSVTVKNAKKGKDYTVAYKNNNAPGIASVIIKGKGNYTGSVELTFNIRLKKTTAKIKNSMLKWASVSGADGYEIYYSRNGGKYKKLTDTANAKYDCTKLKKGSYKLKIRSYSNANNGVVYSAWSKIVSYTKK